MKKKPIIDATGEELFTFATLILNLEGPPRDRPGLLAAIINAGHDQDWIVVSGEEEDALQLGGSDEAVQVVSQYGNVGDPPAKMPPTGFPYWTRPEKGKPECPMVVLRILPTDRPGGNEPAHPIINNSPPLVIQRNKLVEIPHDFYLVLRQAGGTKYLPGEKPNDPLIAIDYFEYPMVDVILPDPRKVRAWGEWSGAQELGAPRAAEAA